MKNYQELNVCYIKWQGRLCLLEAKILKTFKHLMPINALPLAPVLKSPPYAIILSDFLVIEAYAVMSPCIYVFVILLLYRPSSFDPD